MQESNIEQELDPRYECPICLSCLKDPVLTSCGHRFCDTCINTWLESKGGCCPVDGARLDRAVDLFPDRFTGREILSQRTTCRPCNLEMSLPEFEEHLLTHSEHSGEAEDDGCPFRSLGCEAEVSKHNLKEHLDAEIHRHLCLVKNSHEKLQENVKKSDKASDALAQEALLWEPEEKGKEHQNTSLMRALYERVVVLEQRCHEQSAQMQTLRAEMRTAETKIHEISLLHACGHYLWTIRHFAQKVVDMRYSEKRLFFSDGFYTSPTGYKICGRISLLFPNCEELSLFIHLMKSPHDAALDWPFTGRIHLAVVHPTDPALSVKMTMMTRPDLDAFKRPQRDMNTKAYGYPAFVSVADIFHKGFLLDDALLVKIHIQCV